MMLLRTRERPGIRSELKALRRTLDLRGLDALGVGNQNSGIVHIGKNGPGTDPICGTKHAYQTLAKESFANQSPSTQCKKCKAVAEEWQRRKEGRTRFEPLPAGTALPTVEELHAMPVKKLVELGHRLGIPDEMLLKSTGKPKDWNVVITVVRKRVQGTLDASFGRGEGGYTREQLVKAVARWDELRRGKFPLRKARAQILAEQGVNLNKVDINFNDYRQSNDKAFDAPKDYRAIAAEVRRIHNAATKEYKEAFASVGARLWRADHAHALSTGYLDFIAANPDRLRYAHLSRPLTILDSYPEAQKHRAKLDKKVDEIYQRRKQELSSLLRQRGIRPLNDKAFSETEHPRRQPDNPGQFAPAPGGSTSKTESPRGKPAAPTSVKADFTANYEGNEAKQPTSSLDELYDLAKKDTPGFQKDVVKAAGKSGSVVYTSTKSAEPNTILKSRASAQRKLNSELKGDASQLKDVLRATVVHKDWNETRAAAMDFIKAHRDSIVRVKDRVVNPIAGGYRDLLINYRTASGLITEVQFNTDAMVQAKNGAAHKVYEQLRELKDPTPAQVEELERKQAALYAKAYEESGNGELVRKALSSVG